MAHGIEEERHGPGKRSRDGRLVVVSNRLPVVLNRDSDGEWGVDRGSGGLVTALEPVLSRSSGLWMGWPGIEEEKIPEMDRLLERQSREMGYRLRGIGLTPREREDFYLGFSNQVIWPLFHDFQDRCNFLPHFWDAYTEVNRKFADRVEGSLRAGDFVWIHDYHLMGVAEALRRNGMHRPAGFFLHTPFPALDLLRKLPWRHAILRSLLHYDLLGFQTIRDQENFLHCVRCLGPSAEVEENGREASVRLGSRTVRVGAFPISIDVDEFAGLARESGIAGRALEIRRTLRCGADEGAAPLVLLLGVDRLDYSKGIPQKLRGFQLALRKYPELRGVATLVQLIVPSREDIPEYHKLKEEIDRLVGEICGEFMQPGWTPVVYQYRQWDREELVAHYRAAQVALVTPLKDGMNLVAKEFCAASFDGDGVLVLSEHAGAAAQLHSDALMVNPYDVEEVAEAIRRACTMEWVESRARMRRLRAGIRREDIHWWARSFLESARKEEGRAWKVEGRARKVEGRARKEARRPRREADVGGADPLFH